MDAATTVDAVFTDGAFRPVGEVALAEGRPRPADDPAAPPPPMSPAEVAELLARLAAHREALFEKCGYFTDSTEIIAAGRQRDG